MPAKPPPGHLSAGPPADPRDAFFWLRFRVGAIVILATLAGGTIARGFDPLIGGVLMLACVFLAIWNLIAPPQSSLPRLARFHAVKALIAEEIWRYNELDGTYLEARITAPNPSMRGLQVQVTGDMAERIARALAAQGWIDRVPAARGGRIRPQQDANLRVDDQIRGGYRAPAGTGPPPNPPRQGGTGVKPPIQVTIHGVADFPRGPACFNRFGEPDPKIIDRDTGTAPPRPPAPPAEEPPQWTGSKGERQPPPQPPFRKP